MSRIRALFLGLLTEHVQTKAMALVVAIVVFLFVQGQLQGTHKVDELTIVFELARGAENNKVLLKDTYILRDITFKGLKDDVDNVVRDLEKRLWTIRIVIDQAFLDQYPVGPAINQEFCEKQKIPADNVKLQEDPENPPQIVYDQRIRINGVRIVPAPDIGLTLDESVPFEAPRGDKLVLQFDPATVNISGPARAFRDVKEGGTLQVAFEPLGSFLRGKEPRPETDEFGGPTISSIDWEESGFDPDYVRLLRIEMPEDVGPKQLEELLTFTFEVKPRRKEVAVEIDLQFRDRPNRPERIDLKDKYNLILVEGIPVFEETFIENGRAQQFKLRMPQSMVPDAAKHAGKLVLILDLSGIEIADEIRIPVHLAVKDPNDRELLDAVSLVTNGKPARLGFKARQ